MKNPLHPKGTRTMPPTKKHRPAVWENMLGTVYAYNGKAARYFDYDWEAAYKYAGVTTARDPRLHKPVRRVSYPGGVTPPNKPVLWILK